MTIHGAGFSARSGAGNNDKTTVAGKGYFVGNVPSWSYALPGRNWARLNCVIASQNGQKQPLVEFLVFGWHWAE